MSTAVGGDPLPPEGEARAEDAGGKKSRRWGPLRVLLLLVGIGSLVAFVWTAGPETIAANVAQVGWGFGYLVILSMLWRFVAAIGMYLLIDPVHQVSFFRVMWIRMGGEAVNTLTPFANMGGEPVKAVLLAKEIGPSASTGVVVLDKTVLYIGSVIFMTTGMAFGVVILADHPAVLYGALAIIAAWLLFLVLVVWRQVRGDLVVKASAALRVIGIRLSDERRRKLEAIDAVMAAFWRGHRARVLAAIGFHFIGRAMRFADVAICVWLLGETMSFSVAYFVAAVGMLVNTAFSFIPGSLGASEGGHGFVFEVIGLGVSAGVSVGLIRRIRTYALAGVTYLVFVGFSRENRAPSASRS